MPRLRRFHLDLVPQTMLVSGRQVTFVGVTFHSRSVMVEYDVEPPVVRDGIFGPCLLVLVATDDTNDVEPYPTMWEDFDWGCERPGRLTTRLDRRPPTAARELTVNVHALNTGEPAFRLADPPVGVISVLLPDDHASPA